MFDVGHGAVFIERLLVFPFLYEGDPAIVIDALVQLVADATWFDGGGFDQ
jgi:hypothetical protein